MTEVIYWKVRAWILRPDALLPKQLASFDTKKEAVEYARDHGIDTTIKDYTISAGGRNGMPFNGVSFKNSNNTMW